MGKINILDKQVAELIAAGEVVERPASVIKELLENAIDSGAAHITAEIQHGGITYLRVTDDGCGIEPEDVRAAFLRHATSKISCAEDLGAIGTLGFRGEALASICAVSRVTLLTRAEGALSGVSYRIEGGEEIALDSAGCPQGTTIIVRDLFFNTPARMKFLKKDVTEANAAASVVDKIALSHPEIAVRFIRDGKVTLETPGNGDLLQTVYAVYGKEITAALLPVSYEFGGVGVTGYVSAPHAGKANRTFQNFFINRRYVRTRTAMAALEEAYKGSIMVGKFPACFLFLEIAAQGVDVNVHPAKIEVRFVNERPIFDAVYHAVKSAITKGDTLKEMKLPEKEKNPFWKTSLSAPAQQTKFETAAPSPEKTQEPQDPLPPRRTLEEILGVSGGRTPAYFRENPRRTGPDFRNPATKQDRPESFVSPAPSVSKPERIEDYIEEEPPKAGEQEIRILDTPVKIRCEVFDTYIVAEYGQDRLLLIDKHAAHERLLYEKLRANREIHAQTLLSPITVTLGKEEYAAALENRETLMEAGYEVEDFGPGTLLVRSVPTVVSPDEAQDQVTEIAGYLSENRMDVTTEKLDWLYHNIACRAAIKAGSESSPQELAALAKELYENPQIRYCPHGRPVYSVITKYELDKQFGRIV